MCSIPEGFVGEINIPIVERNVRGTYKMMLSPEYNDLTKLVMPKGKREHIDSSLAITKYRVLDSNYGVSLVECQPVTGVKHQIRTHLAHALGTPILGDHKYSHYAKLAPQVIFTFPLNSIELFARSETTVCHAEEARCSASEGPHGASLLALVLGGHPRFSQSSAEPVHTRASLAPSSLLHPVFSFADDQMNRRLLLLLFLFQ